MVAIEKMNNFPLAGREVRPPPLSLSRRRTAQLTHSSFSLQIKVGLVADRSATFSQHVGGAGQQEQQLEREEGHSASLSFSLLVPLAHTDEERVLQPASSTPTRAWSSCRSCRALTARPTCLRPRCAPSSSLAPSPSIAPSLTLASTQVPP